MKRLRLFCSVIVILCVVFIGAPALAKSLKVHITGPAKEHDQWVGKAFTIGVSASGFDQGSVTVSSSAGTATLPMERTKMNYLPFTPTVSGAHTITATVTLDGSDQKRTSSVTIMVYPISAEERAAWMVQTALACVGSTDAEKFVRYAHIKADADWCAAFIGWCAKQVRIPDGAGLQSIYAGVNIYRLQAKPTCKTCLGNYLARFSATVLDHGEVVQPGDLVFFIWGSKVKAQLAAHPGYTQHWHGNASHVGLVTSVQDDHFTFVHGNIRMKHNTFGVALNLSTDKKEDQTYADWVIAFARPHYDYAEIP